MVYSPRIYLVSASVAAVLLRGQHVSAASMYYTTYTPSDTKNELSNLFPGVGFDLSEEFILSVVNIDPTLPDVAKISTVPVVNPELLANQTHDVTFVVSDKVGVALLSLELPNDQTASLHGKALPTTTPSIGAQHKDCTTGWEKPATRKLAESNHLDQSRRLNAFSNKDLDQFEDYFNVTFETNFTKLPIESKEIPAPWPGPYWPTYQDGIGVIRKPKTLSAAAKYATAFGKNVTKFLDEISARYGIDSQMKAPQCSNTSQCGSSDTLTACGIRANRTEGRCIPKWYGICHAWSAAAISEPEPICPVTHNDVEFQVLDLKALLSVLYDDTKVGTAFAGARFRTGTLEKDEFGRMKDPALRDINPGFFHIAVTNLLGILGKSFVVDIEAGREVWNQPVRGFKVYEQTAFTLEQAANTFYKLAKYPWNEDAKRIVYIKLRLTWIIESYEEGPLVSTGRVDKYTTGAFYTYLLELNEHDQIIGGEWVYASLTNHIDFMWLIRTKPAPDAMTSTGISYEKVSELLKKSVDCSDSRLGTTPAAVLPGMNLIPLNLLT